MKRPAVQALKGLRWSVRAIFGLFRRGNFLSVERAKFGVKQHRQLLLDQPTAEMRFNLVETFTKESLANFVDASAHGGDLKRPLD